MRQFTRLPKLSYLLERGCPVEAVPTYLALSDHAHNTSGLAWPSMRRLAGILGRSTRTIQRHIHMLQALGLVEIVERRRWRGRYSSYTYKVLHFAELIRRKKAGSTTGPACPVGEAIPYKERTRHSRTPPKSPSETKEEQRRRRRQGYEWLFD